MSREAAVAAAAAAKKEIKFVTVIWRNFSVKTSLCLFLRLSKLPFTQFVIALSPDNYNYGKNPDIKQLNLNFC